MYCVFLDVLQRRFQHPSFPQEKDCSEFLLSCFCILDGSLLESWATLIFIGPLVSCAGLTFLLGMDGDVSWTGILLMNWIWYPFYWQNFLNPIDIFLVCFTFRIYLLNIPFITECTILRDASCISFGLWVSQTSFIFSKGVFT